MLLSFGAGEDSWESLDCKEIKPVNSKGNHPEYSLEGLMLKLKLQYFGHLMWRANSLEKTLMLGKSEDSRRRQQRTRCLNSITDSMDMNFSKLWEDRGAWCATVHGVAKSWTQLSDWTTTIVLLIFFILPIPVGENWHLVVLIFIFLIFDDVWEHFQVLIRTYESYIFFCEVSIQVFCRVLLGCLSFLLLILGVVKYTLDSSSCQFSVLQKFSPSL